MFKSNEFFARKIYKLDDPNSRLKDTEYSLNLIEQIAKRNNTTLQAIFAQKVVPRGGLHWLDFHDKDNKLTTIEHIFKKEKENLSYTDPKNKILMIGKLKKIIWKDKIEGNLIVDYNIRIQNNDYFI
ncbi:MAG: hypothetical protein ACTSWY_06965 [Promethearchaeota archaeon]